MGVELCCNRLSLIIATYNRGPLIARTLDSVLSQTQPPDEILVVDDCSTDDTGEWVRQHYPQVRVLKTERNVHTAAARNFGAQYATGDILLFLDHDDELLTHAVRSLADSLRGFPRARASFADHTYQNHAAGIFFTNHHRDQAAFARLTAIPTLQQGKGTVRLYSKAMYYALLRGNLLQQPWAIYRQTFLDLGGFDPKIRYCEDWDFYLRVARAVPLVLSDEVISHHHIEGENLHLAQGQEEMHLRVLSKQLQAVGWRDPRARFIVQRRIAGYFKNAGDREVPTSLWNAWKWYVRSVLHWPLDYVVAARTLGWPFRIALWGS